MALIVKGVTIPTTSPFKFKGQNMNVLKYKNITYWASNTFKGLWNGAQSLDANAYGIQSSGNSIRLRTDTIYGGWVSVSGTGVFTGSSEIIFAVYGTSYSNINSSGNNIRSSTKYNDNARLYGGWISLNTSSGFVGNSIVPNDGTAIYPSMVTSGFNLRSHTSGTWMILS